MYWLIFRVGRYAVMCTDCKSTNGVQLEGTPTIPPSYIRVRAIVWACGRGQLHRQTDRKTHIRARPIYISRRVRLTRNAMIYVLYFVLLGRIDVHAL